MLNEIKEYYDKKYDDAIKEYNNKKEKEYYDKIDKIKEYYDKKYERYDDEINDYDDEIDEL